MRPISYFVGKKRRVEGLKLKWDHWKYGEWFEPIFKCAKNKWHGIDEDGDYCSYPDDDENDCWILLQKQDELIAWAQKLPKGLKIRDVVDQLIIKTIIDCKGVKVHCAESLGLSHRGFQMKINAMQKRGVKLPPVGVLHSSNIKRPHWLGPRKQPPAFEL